jgi:hypothetical protein
VTATNDVLQLFDEKANWPGGASPDLGSDYRPKSIRSVLAPAPTERGSGVYAAQRGTTKYCIIVQNVDLIGSAARERWCCRAVRTHRANSTCRPRGPTTQAKHAT